jgi:hypothetical protein
MEYFVCFFRKNEKEKQNWVRKNKKLKRQIRKKKELRETIAKGLPGTSPGPPLQLQHSRDSMSTTTVSAYLTMYPPSLQAL